MKEKCSYKRFDLLSVLAVLGVGLVLLFESIFIFELYRVDYEKLEPYLPRPVKAWLTHKVPEDDPSVIPAKPEPVSVREPVTDDGDIPEQTNQVVPVG